MPVFMRFFLLVQLPVEAFVPNASCLRVWSTFPSLFWLVYSCSFLAYHLVVCACVRMCASCLCVCAVHSFPLLLGQLACKPRREGGHFHASVGALELN